MACQTNWAGSSERTGSTALCASEKTDMEVSSTRMPITITTFSFKAIILPKSLSERMQFPDQSLMQQCICVLTIFLCIAMMYPMKGLSCTGAMCPLATPLARGISGLQGSTMLGPPLGMKSDSLVRRAPPTEPLAIGVRSNERRTRGNGETSHKSHALTFRH